MGTAPPLRRGTVTPVSAASRLLRRKGALRGRRSARCGALPGSPPVGRCWSLETSALFANATDPARRQRGMPIGTMSPGCDSVATVMARDAGCAEAPTGARRALAAPGTLDSGEESAARAADVVASLPRVALQCADVPVGDGPGTAAAAGFA